MASKDKIQQAVKTLQNSFDQTMATWLKKQSAWLELEGFTPEEMMQIMKSATSRQKPGG